MDKTRSQKDNAEDLLKPSTASNVLRDLGLTLLQSAAIDPARGVAQIVDKTTGNFLTLESGIKTLVAKAGYEQVAPAEFSTASWYAQQLGAAVGMMAPYLAMRGVVLTGANKIYGEQALSTLHHAGLRASIGSAQTGKLALSESIIAGTSGFGYGLVFVPTESSNSQNHSFIKERVNHALYDAAAFGAIGAMSPYIGKGMGKIASAVEQGHIGRYGNYRLKNYESTPPLARTFEISQQMTANVLRSAVFTGAISGVPIGLVNAEIGALKSGNWLPDLKDVKENVVAMMFVGGALATANKLAAPKEPDNTLLKDSLKGWSRMIDEGRPLRSSYNEMLLQKEPSPKTVEGLDFFSSKTQFRSTSNESTNGQATVTEILNRRQAEHTAEIMADWQSALRGRFNELTEPLQAILFQAWPKLTEGQKLLPIQELLDHAKVIGALNLGKAQAALLAEHPEFTTWLKQKKNNSMTAEDGAIVLQTWINDPQLRSKSPKELVALAKLTPEQKAQPIENQLHYAEIIAELALSKELAATLKDPDAGFVEWYRKNRGVFNRELDDAGRRSKLPAALEHWNELSVQADRIPARALAELAAIWTHMSEAQKSSNSSIDKVVGISTRLSLKPAEISQVTPSFVEWYSKLPFHDFSHGSVKKVLERWNSLTESQRSMNISDLFVAVEFNSKMLELDNASLLPHIELAKHLRLGADAKGLTPDFLSWYNSNKTELYALAKDSMDTSTAKHIAYVWNELPPESRKLSVENLSLLAQSWKSLSEAQRMLPQNELLVIAQLASKYYVPAETRERLTGHSDFAAKFNRLEQRWSKNSSWSLDVREFAAAWPELPEHVKRMSDRDLIITASTWRRLTPEQKQLPAKELTYQAHIVREIHLNAAEAALIQTAPGFVEWFRQREHDKAGFGHRLESISKKVLSSWDQLTPEMRKLPAKDIKPIMEAWDKLTPEHKRMNPRDLAEQAFVINELTLSADQVKALSTTTDFAPWFRKNDSSLGLAHLSTEKDLKGWREKLAEIWNDLPKERIELDAKSAKFVGAAWDFLTSEQRKLPMAELISQSTVVTIMRLDSEMTKLLGEHPDFVKQNLISFEQLGPNRTRESEINWKLHQVEVLLNWSEMTREAKSLNPKDLQVVALFWRNLTSEQRQLPIGDIVKLSRTMQELQITPESVSAFANVSRFVNWYHSIKPETLENSQRIAITNIFNKWSKMNDGDAVTFENWLSKNYKGNEVNFPSPNKMQTLNQMVIHWDQFSQLEKKGPASALVEKTRTLSEMAQSLHGEGIVPRVPQKILDQIAEMKIWRQIAAIETFKRITTAERRRLQQNEFDKDTWNSFVNSKEFAEKFEHELGTELAKGRSEVLANSYSARRLFQAYHPSMEPVFMDLAAAALAGSHPSKYVQRIKPGEYKDALKTMLGKDAHKIDELAKLDLLEAADHPLVAEIKQHHRWENESAVKLLTTFGANWRTVNGKPGWLELQERLGRNAHDATTWLAMPPKDSANSLGSFLLRFYDREPNEIGVIAKRWETMTEAQRSASYKEVLSTALSSQYADAKHNGLAVEAARWGVDTKEFTGIQERFLKSLETPSPFPLEQTWTSDGLTARFIPRADARGLFLGRHTDCCQHPSNSTGRSSAWLGQESPSAGFFVVESGKRKDIVAQSLVWESDNGGLMFDSIEGKKISDRAEKVADLYEKAAADLKGKYHTINIGNGSVAGQSITGLKRWVQVDDANTMKLPFDYGGYTDARTTQVRLAHNPEIEVREKPQKQVWMRGASIEDLPAAQRIVDQVYPAGWRFIPQGDWNRVMEMRGKGVIGGYVLDTHNRAVNDVFVHPDHRSLSRIALFDMLRKIRTEGGEWSASMRDSTSYQLLQKAVAARWVTITSETKQPGRMQGEDMHAVRFRVNAPIPAR